MAKKKAAPASVKPARVVKKVQPPKAMPRTIGWPEKETELLYKLRMVVEDQNSTPFDFLEPVIREYIEMAFELLRKRMASGDIQGR